VTLDGVVAHASLLSALTAFVPQDDTLMRSLTVEDCIRYVQFCCLCRLQPMNILLAALYV
jgi:ABC-type multidrug transport system ATPase subunit